MEAAFSTRHQISHTVVNVKRVIIVFQVKNFEDTLKKKEKNERLFQFVIYVSFLVYLEVEFTLLLLMIR